MNIDKIIENIKLMTDKDKNIFFEMSTLPKIKSISDEDFFNLILDLPEDHEALSKLLLFIKSANACGGASALYDKSREVADKLVDDIRATEAFDFYEQSDIRVRHPLDPVHIEKAFYHPDNNGKKFVSIDLKKANFQALTLVDKSILLNQDSYDDLIRKYTSDEFLISSKDLRQFIFRKLKPKQQIIIQEGVVNYLVSALKHSGIADPHIQVHSSDEVIVLNTMQNLEKINTLINSIRTLSFANVAVIENREGIDRRLHTQRPVSFDVSQFTLNLVKSKTNKSYYYKKNNEGEVVSIKTVPPKELMSIIDAIKNQELELNQKKHNEKEVYHEPSY